ncbi:MAG: hypothetical protein IJB01_07280 [Bacteroidaceae bacterium]|nr:hypothetical protein [Bacteroidaceae bacterium]
MTQREMEFKELEELKQQFNLLDEKLEKQRIINEEIIGETIKEKLSHIEKWYRNRFKISLVSAPIVGITFLVMYVGKGIGYWGFGLFILAVGAFEYLLNRRCYKALDIKQLPSMSMTEAQERIVNHKRLRSFTDKLLTLPYIALIAWTILVASGFAWNTVVIAITICAMALSISLGYCQQKANRKRLDAVLRHIKSLRGEN